MKDYNFDRDIHMYRVEYIRNSSLQITKGKCSFMNAPIHRTRRLAVEKFEPGNKYCLLIRECKLLINFNDLND